MENIALQFSVKELVALLGLAQSVYVLVFMGFRSGRISRSFIPALFFLMLSFAFLLMVAKSHWQSLVPHYSVYEWFSWMLLIPLSTLVAFQVARINSLPPVKYWLIMLIPVIGYVGALGLGHVFGNQDSWLDVVGVIVGAIGLLVLWARRDWLDGISKRKNGKERFWIIISLVVLNACLVSVFLFKLNGVINASQMDIVRIIIGLSFVYIVSTSLFRIYPYAVFVQPAETKTDIFLTQAEVEIALKIENLLHRDKVYQEASYGRSDMAKELGVTEAQLSKVVNHHFNKSVPSLLNELRIEEAKTLLRQTNADITVIAGEAGFNSIATFNRVFKDIEGVSPSNYRDGK